MWILSQSKIEKGQMPLERRKVMSTEGSRGMPLKLSLLHKRPPDTSLALFSHPCRLPSLGKTPRKTIELITKNLKRGLAEEKHIFHQVI